MLEVLSVLAVMTVLAGLAGFAAVGGVAIVGGRFVCAGFGGCGPCSAWRLATGALSCRRWALGGGVS